jgi:hypothetical protein
MRIKRVPGKTMAAAIAVFWAGLGVPALADRPVALIESLSNAPEAEAQSFDYLYDNDKVDLRPGGTMTVSYFSNCIAETFTGGVAKFDEDDGGSATKGGSSTQATRNCRTTQVAMTEEMAEAGAAVKRLTPFEESDWQEWTVRTAPIFKWEQPKRADGPTTVRVEFMDAPAPSMVWEGTTTGSYLAFPEGGPVLQVGEPYRVVAHFSNGDEADGIFSVDPALEVDNTTQNRLVPLDW